MANLLFRNGQNAEALQLYSTSLAAKDEAKDRAGAAYTHGRFAAYRLRQLQLVEAESEGRQAIDLHVAVGDRVGGASALATLAAIEWATTKRSQGPREYRGDEEPGSESGTTDELLCDQTEHLRF